MYTGTQSGEGSAPNAPPPSYNASAPPPGGDYTAPPPPGYTQPPPAGNNYGVQAPQPMYGQEGGQPVINNFQHPPPTASYQQPPPNQGYQPPVMNQGYNQPPQQQYVPAQNYTQAPQQQYVPHPTTQVANTSNTRPAGRPKYANLSHKPVKTTCRNCGEYVTTKITEQGPDCGTCAICCLVSVCICPLCGIAACCWDRTWSHTHSCPKCGHIIGTKDAFGAHYTHNR